MRGRIARWTWLAVLIMVMGSAVVSADTMNPRTPKAAAQAVISATFEGDYLRYAALMHPEVIREFQAMLGSVVSSEEAGPLRELLFGTSDLLELGRFNDLELMALFLGLTIQRSPELHGVLGNAVTMILGVVYEGEDLAHVVYRMDFEVLGVQASSPALLTMKRHEDSWRLALTTEMRIFMQQIASAVQP